MATEKQAAVSTNTAVKKEYPAPQKEKESPEKVMTVDGMKEQEKPLDVKTLSAEEEEKYQGELEPGDVGYLPIDDKGYPTGPAVKERPDPNSGQRYATVMAVRKREPATLATPSGAPLTIPLAEAPDSAKRVRANDMAKAREEKGKDGNK